MTPPTTLADALRAHRVVFQMDGDYGEHQWVECSCGDDWTGSVEADHADHLAAALLAPSGWFEGLAQDEAVVREAARLDWAEGGHADDWDQIAPSLRAFLIGQAQDRTRHLVATLRTTA